MGDLPNILRYVRNSVIVRIIKRGDAVAVPKLMDCHQMSRVFSHFPVYAKKTVNAGMAFQILQNERFFFSRIGYAEGNHAEILGQYGHALFIKSVLKTVYAVRGDGVVAVRRKESHMSAALLQQVKGGKL